MGRGWLHMAHRVNFSARFVHDGEGQGDGWGLEDSVHEGKCFRWFVPALKGMMCLCAVGKDLWRGLT